MEKLGKVINFTVRWRPRAEGQLAELWTNSPDRNAIAAAADRIDAILRQRPSSFGESRSGRERIAFDPPLAVLFDVYEEDRIVRVKQVARYTPKPRG